MATGDIDQLTASPSKVRGLEVHPLSIRQIGQLFRTAKGLLKKDKADELQCCTWLDKSERTKEYQKYCAQIEDTSFVRPEGQRILISYLSSFDGFQELIDISVGHPVDIPLDRGFLDDVVQEILSISGLTTVDAEKKSPTAKT